MGNDLGAFIHPDVFKRADELSHAEFRLYACYLRYRNKETGLSYPGRKTIFEDTNIGVTYISDLTSSLQKKGWITKEGWQIRALVGVSQKSDKPTNQKSDSPNIAPEKPTIGKPKSRIYGEQKSDVPPQKSDFLPSPSINTELLELSSNHSDTRAREIQPLPFEPVIEKPSREFGTVIKWIEQNAAMEIQTPGSFARNLMNARGRDCERPIDPELYHRWVLNCFEDVGPPGDYADFDIWRKEVNSCLKNSRVTGRYCSPKKGNGKSGNGQYKSKAEKTNDGWRELAEQLAAEGD